MGLRLKNSSGNYVELNAPSSIATDFDLTLPVNDGDANEFLQTNGSGTLSFAVPSNLGTAATASGTNLQFNSGYGSVATAYGLRAWINFDGGAGTIGTGRGSGNMDAVTDNGAGDYTVNFTNDMPDVNYGVLLGCERDATNYLPNTWVQTRAVGSVDIYSGLVNASSILAGWDVSGVNVGIVR